MPSKFTTEEIFDVYADETPILRSGERPWEIPGGEEPRGTLKVHEFLPLPHQWSLK